MARATVLIAEDDEELAEVVKECFGQRSIDADIALTGMQFYQRLAVGNYQIVVVDLGLPDEDGLNIVRYLREHNSALGIVILTARGSRQDRIDGYQEGADLYIVKPFSCDEFSAAIENLQRRLLQKQQECAVWHYDQEGWLLTSPRGATLKLTTKENQIFQALMSVQGEVMRRGELRERAGYEYTDDYSSMDAMVRRLQRKLKDLDDNLPLKSVYAQGYMVSRNVKMVAV